MPKKDARHNIFKVLASRRAHYRLRGARRDFFGQDVICHGRGRTSDKETRTTLLRGKNDQRGGIKKRWKAWSTLKLNKVKDR